jgi:hypothetical protein
VSARTVRNVGRGVFRRSVKRICVYAKDGEVARVSGPHPVVGVTAELTDSRGRSAYKSDVFEDLIEVEEVLVARVERLYYSV